MRSYHSARWIKSSSATLFVILLSSTWSRAQSPPSQNPDPQQPKDKLQQLEQSMLELKAQISAARVSSSGAVQEVQV